MHNALRLLVANHSLLLRDSKRLFHPHVTMMVNQDGYKGLLIFLLLKSALSAAWRPASLAPFKTPAVLQNPSAALSGAFGKLRPSKLKLSDEVEESSDMIPFDVNENRLIQVNSDIKLPFSREVAFDAYSDLTRQPSWSSWLHSVEYLDAEKTNSKWTMRFLKLKYSWTAVALRNERPNVIQWQSTSGLRNFGTVEFKHNRDDEKYPTLMTMRMTFVAPRAAASVFRRSKAMASFVREKMVMDSMLNFREIVSSTDPKEGDASVS